MHWQNMYSQTPFFWPYFPNQQEPVPSNQNFFILPYAPKIQYAPLATFSQNSHQISPIATINHQQPLPQVIPQPQPVLAQQPQNLPKENSKSNPSQLMGCQCLKSKCVKEYCFCFKNGVSCHEKCHCVSCKNKKNSNNRKHQNKKNKIINCNCIWSKCSKKYCQCFANGKECGESCNCLNCRN